jgi:hypothetical protein
VRRVEGRFKLTNPITDQFAGYLQLVVEWVPVLAAVRQASAPTAEQLETLPLGTSTESCPDALEGIGLLEEGQAVVEVSIMNAAVQASPYIPLLQL